MSHTPGPWEWVTEDEGDVIILCKDGDYFEGFVLECSKCDSCKGTASRCTLPTAENAALIQAAPDMYDACEDIVRTPARALAGIQENDFVFDGSGGRWEKLAFTLYNMLISNASVAEQAIDRAKGE
jgi:hypothetical protein